MHPLRRLCQSHFHTDDLLRLDLQNACVTILQGCAIQRQNVRQLHSCNLGHAGGSVVRFHIMLLPKPRL